MTALLRQVFFREVLRPNSRPYTLASDQDADLVGMRLYGAGPFHRELKPAMRITKKSHFVIRTGDVIYNKLFAWKGTFGLVPPELDGMYVSDKFPTYELDRSQVYDRYLFWYFRHTDIWEQARLLSTGSAALSKLTLNPPKFLELKMPLPLFEEQRRIANILDRIERKVTSATSNRSAAIEANESMIWSICESYLARCGQIADPEPISSLVDQDRGISYGIVQTGAEYPDGVPTIRAGDLHWFEVKYDGLKKVDPSVEQAYRRTRLQGSEVLLRIRGGVGELAVCPPELKGGNVSREVAVIPFLPRIDPNYAMYMLSAPSSQKKMHGYVRGTSYVGINLKDVRKIMIPVPDLATQVRVVDEIVNVRKKIDDLKLLQIEISGLIERLTPSLLNSAFSGAL